MLTRRDLIKQTIAGGIASTALSSRAPADESSSKITSLPAIDWGKVRGFNFTRSCGTEKSGAKEHFSAAQVDADLRNAKKLFPGINALRWLLDWDQYKVDPDNYLSNFEAGLSIAEKYGCAVMPILFNRYHDFRGGAGGIYIDHFLPADPSNSLFDEYLSALIGGHKDDRRILAWDLCNEPYVYNLAVPPTRRGYLHAFVSADRPAMPPVVVEAETRWLKSLHEKCKNLRASAPVTVGIWMGAPLEDVVPFSDVLSVHPYYLPTGSVPTGAVTTSKREYEDLLDVYVDISRQSGKPLLATECCWADVSDAARVEAIQYQLAQLKKRDIGFFAFALSQSHADPNGNFSFMDSQGRLRRGHGVFNEY